jgi:hypothetical protein
MKSDELNKQFFKWHSAVKRIWVDAHLHAIKATFTHESESLFGRKRLSRKAFIVISFELEEGCCKQLTGLDVMASSWARARRESAQAQRIQLQQQFENSRQAQRAPWR